jgi:hypothetical protein
MAKTKAKSGEKNEKKGKGKLKKITLNDLKKVKGGGACTYSSPCTRGTEK